MERSRRAMWSAVIVAVVLLIGAALTRAQSRGERDDVTIRHVDPDGSSRPFPVTSMSGSSAIRPGNVYEIYFNGSVYVPGLGPRQKLFIAPETVSADGWITVIFGDEVRDKGQSNASVAPIAIPEDMVPRTPFEWRIYYTAIAAVSPALNASGVAASQAQHWPE